MSLTSKAARLAAIILLSSASLVAACSSSEDSTRQAATMKDTTTAETSATSTVRVGTNGQYANVNGLRMYYETHGLENATARPLVLLHGAFSQIRTDFSELLPRWAKDRRVIAIELQGHGHTGDIDRPLTYKQMADDAAELLRQLDLQNVDIFGYSMGGGVGLRQTSRSSSRRSRRSTWGGRGGRPSRSKDSKRRCCSSWGTPTS